MVVTNFKKKKKVTGSGSVVSKMKTNILKSPQLIVGGVTIVIFVL